MEYKIFKQKFNDNIDYDFVIEISKQFSISYLSALLLFQKGFRTYGEIEEFLNPKEDDLYDPFILCDMKKSIERINEAIKYNQKVMIFCDYDCDGIISSVILHDILMECNLDAEILMPNRFSNGYGLNDESMKYILESDIDLLITVDNGITSVKEVDILNDSGIDVIITDHHNISENIPNAYAIINPKAEYENYPFKDLCGAGVVLKLIQGIIKYNDIDYDFNEVLVLAMIATVADLVSLKGENRVIVSLGLKYLKYTKNKGLKALISKAKFNINTINSGTVAFQIAPRINAIGRIDDGKYAIRLLLSDDDYKIEEYANMLCKANEKRKNIEEDIFKRAEDIIEKEDLLNKESVLFILGEEFNEGVMGIAASKVSEKYNRPVVILTKSGDYLKASCRSIFGFDIFECLNYSKNLFLRFGGHSQAAGFSIKEENLDKLIRRSNEYALSHNIENLFYKRLYYDTNAIISNLNIKTSLEFDKFAPFGLANSKPVIFIQNVKITNVRRIGSDSSHLKFNALFNGNYYDCIAFGLGHYMDIYDFNNHTFDMIFNLSVNYYQNRSTLQLEVKDIDYYDVNLNEYYISLYNLFSYSFEDEDYINLEVDKDFMLKNTIENVIENNRDSLFVVYSKDIYIRIIKYLKYKGYEYNIFYNAFGDISENKVNIIVNPISEIVADRKIIVLDTPNYCMHHKKVFENTLPVFYGKGKQNGYNITREFFLYLYKKFKLLLYTKNNIYEFIDNIKNNSDIEINYFTFRVALDIMVEMEILNYSIENDKISLEFKRIEKKKDIYSTRIMQKLREN